MNVVPEEQPATEDTVFDELLRAMSEQLDIRAMFPRVSAVASRILPHDRLSLSFHHGHGHVTLEAASNGDLPNIGPIQVDDAGRSELDRPFFIAGDLLRAPLPIKEPRDLNDRITALGYRSLLRVHLRARDEAIGLAFWSKRADAYSVADVLTAQRIADHVALAVSHEQLAELARQSAAAQVRAERFDPPVARAARPDAARSAHIVGRSDRWKAAEKRALQVAPTDATVLLMGESGTGKEMMARFIHRSSRRERGPFVAINCAALPEQLFESELFGHERGAFTGASAAKPGHIELASGGVLFLDEVTEMSLSAQSKFLRVLQEREFQRLGGTRLLKADMRVIAAANRDLRAAVERGTFRQDLYYRLQVFEIRLPALRERPSDILPLSEFFLEDIAPALRRPVGRLSRDAIRALLAYPWPGNVRELRNALERAAILADGGLITPAHLGLPAPAHLARSTGGTHSTYPAHPADPHPGASAHASVPSSTHASVPDSTHAAHPTHTTDLNTLEQQAIAQVLHEVNGNKSEAARRLGLSRTQLYVRLRKHRLGVPEAGAAGGEVTERSYNVE